MGKEYLECNERMLIVNQLERTPMDFVSQAVHKLEQCTRSNRVQRRIILRYWPEKNRKPATVSDPVG